MSYKKRFLNVWLLVVFLGFINASAALSQPLPRKTLDPTTIPKFVTPLVIPPEMPSTSTLPDGTKYYEIAVRQFTQQILPAGFPVTTVWSYGSVNQASQEQRADFSR